MILLERIGIGGKTYQYITVTFLEHYHNFYGYSILELPLPEIGLEFGRNQVRFRAGNAKASGTS